MANKKPSKPQALKLQRRFGRIIWHYTQPMVGQLAGDLDPAVTGWLVADSLRHGLPHQPDAKDMPAPRDVGLVRWRLSRKRLNAERTIRDVPFDSDVRNVFDLPLLAPLPQALNKRVAGNELHTTFNRNPTTTLVESADE